MGQPFLMLIIGTLGINCGLCFDAYLYIEIKNDLLERKNFYAGYMQEGWWRCLQRAG